MCAIILFLLMKWAHTAPKDLHESNESGHINIIACENLPYLHYFYVMTAAVKIYVML